MHIEGKLPDINSSIPESIFVQNLVKKMLQAKSANQLDLLLETISILEVNKFGTDFFHTSEFYSDLEQKIAAHSVTDEDIHVLALSLEKIFETRQEE